jgi:hypothetical protein
MEHHSEDRSADRDANQASRAVVLALAREHYGSCRWLRLQLLLSNSGARDEEQIVQFMVDAFPVMGAKLRDRQPDLCPGGNYSVKLASSSAEAFRAETKSSAPTSDKQESDFSILGWLLLNNTSMLSSTASIHLMARRNHVFAWLLSLPEAERNMYIRMSGPLARTRDKEDRAAGAVMNIARRDKAKREEALQTTVRDEKVAEASSKLWQTDRQMEIALQTKYGTFRTKDAMKTILRGQLTALATAGHWTTPKGFTKAATTVDVMKSFIRGCKPMTDYALGASQASASPQEPQTSQKPSKQSRPRAASVKLPHDAELEDVVMSDDEEDEDASVMPCCGVKYDADGGYHVVQCSKCCEWVHVAKLGSCPGAGVTYNIARSRTFVFCCKRCL